MSIKILIVLAILVLFPQVAFASEKQAGDSARLVTKSVIASEDISRSNMREYLTKQKAIINVLKRYDSPLITASTAFVNTCVRYDLDCYLLPAIAGLESTYGQFIWPNSYNPFGWGGGYIMFEDWSEGIDTVGRGLRVNYIDRGAQDVYDIGRVYSESSIWAVRVERLMRDFAREEVKVRLQTQRLEVEL